MSHQQAKVPEAARAYIRHGFTKAPRPCPTNHASIKFREWTVPNATAENGKWCGECPDCRGIVVIRGEPEDWIVDA